MTMVNRIVYSVNNYFI